MPFQLRFAKVCQKKWDELTGSDSTTRHCETCDRTITNLDSLSDAERDALFRDAIRNGTKPCVFATIPTEGGEPCQVPSLNEPPEFWMTGGEPEMPDLDEDAGEDEIKFNV